MSEEQESQDLAGELSTTLNETPINLEEEAQTEAVKAEPPSPTALDLDRWSVRRGKDWLKECDESKPEENEARDDWGEEVENPSPKALAGDDRELVAADLLAAAWEPTPKLAKSCIDPRRQHFLASMLQTPEYQSLHRQTMLDDVASELAAASFAQQWCALVQTEEPTDELDRDSQAMQSAKSACDQARSDVQDLNDTRSSLGIGGDGPTNSGGMSVQQVKQLFSAIRSNHQLRRIMELAGRYRRLAQSLQHGKPTHGADEVIGIEFGSDLGRLLPSELVQLDDDDLEYDFLRRFVDRSLQVRELRSSENEARGPIVLVVDESGSMSGEPVAHAKAMALAILWVAEHQKRWCCLVGFSGDSVGNFLVIPPGQRDTKTLIDWLAHFYGGGTSMDVPLETLPNRWEELGCPEGRTDIIQITDCAVHVPEELERKFLSWKAEHQARMNTIVIGDDPGDLEHVSDRWWTINELNLESEGVGECLSV